MGRKGLLIGGLILLVLGQGRAWAECSITGVTPVNFGSYLPLSSQPDDSTGSISIFCNRRTSVLITLGVSANSGGFNPRRMANPARGDFLNYNLYRDVSRTQIWGNGTQGTYVVNATVRKNETLTFTIYGRVPGGQDAGVGSFSDGLVITLMY